MIFQFELSNEEIETLWMCRTRDITPAQYHYLKSEAYNPNFAEEYLVTFPGQIDDLIISPIALTIDEISSSIDAVDSMIDEMHLRTGVTKDILRREG